MKKKMTWVVLALLSAAVLLGSAPKLRDINLATGTTTGVYYVLGNGIAQMWNNKVPNVRASAQATEASVQNMNLLQRKETDIATSMNQVVGNAYNGKDKFAGRANKDLRVMTALYPNVVQIIVPANSGIRSVPDLRGKRFVPGAAGSGTETSSREILKVHGIDYNADKRVMKVDFVGFTEAVELMKNGQTDGALISAGVPNAAIMDLTNSNNVKLLSLTPDMIQKIVKEMPWYYPTTIPAGTYKGQTEPVRTVAQANLLVTRADLDEELIYQLTRAIFENKADLVATHSAAKDITLENALNGWMGVPVHPGAARYFKEKGLQAPAN